MANGNWEFGPPKIDDCAGTVEVDPIGGLVRIDGIPVFWLVTGKNNEIILKFYDRDKYRSSYRGTRHIEIPLRVLVSKLEKLLA